MKQKDVALIIVICAVSAIVSLVIGHFVFASAGKRQQKAEVVDAITTSFPLPATNYFNANSIDPTQLITVAQNSNVTPFNGTGQ